MPEPGVQEIMQLMLMDLCAHVSYIQKNYEEDNPLEFAIEVERMMACMDEKLTMLAFEVARERGDLPAIIEKARRQVEQEIAARKN
jgi:hypothetical protein